MSFFLTYFIYAKLTKRWAGDEVYMQFVNRNCTAAVRFKVHKKSTILKSLLIIYYIEVFFSIKKECIGRNNFINIDFSFGEV